MLEINAMLPDRFRFRTQKSLKAFLRNLSNSVTPGFQDNLPQAGQPLLRRATPAAQGYKNSNLEMTES